MGKAADDMADRLEAAESRAAASALEAQEWRRRWRWWAGAAVVLACLLIGVLALGWNLETVFNTSCTDYQIQSGIC